MVGYGANPLHKAKTHFFKDLNLTTILKGEDEVGFTGTKVVATIGPACQEIQDLVGLLNVGVAGARVDLTWGPLEFHRRSLDNLQVCHGKVMVTDGGSTDAHMPNSTPADPCRATSGTKAAMKQSRRMCCTLVDTLGRELMIRRQVKIDENGWPIHEESITVTTGQEVTITTRLDVEASSTMLPITYSRFTEMAEKGDTIYIGRYLVCGADSASLYLEVKEVVGTEVICVAKNDAVLDGLLTVFHVERSSDATTMSNVQNNLPVLSEYDKDCIKLLAQEFDIDFISLSYARTAEDVTETRRFLNGIGCSSTKILAKVETRQSLLNFRGILQEADGIIISRGNLGLDCVPEKMALIQKTLIQACNLIGKPVLLTRVVDTMVNTPRPTRAEATDVANAVLDGVDGILLGAETLRGKYPGESVMTVSKICRAAEKVFDHHYHYEHLMDIAMEVDDIMSVGASDDDSEATDSGSRTGSELDLSRINGNGSANGLSHHGDMHKLKSCGAGLNMAAMNMAKYSTLGSMTSIAGFHNTLTSNGKVRANPFLSKMESLASSAVRAAEKTNASLIVVFTHTGKTAQLVAKYRPPMPILTLVIPNLVSNGLQWKMEGRANARQCLVCRGMLPMLAAPSSNGDAVLEEAVFLASRMNLVKANDAVVVVQRIHEDFCVKILSVDAMGQGIKKLTAPRIKTHLAMSAPFGAAPDSPGFARTSISQVNYFGEHEGLAGSGPPSPTKAL